MKTIKDILFVMLVAAVMLAGFRFYMKHARENKILKQMVTNLKADTRIAEVLVTNVSYDEEDKKLYTTIKFLEYDSAGRPMEPRYFTFSGNIIQFQSLVVRFDDLRVALGDKLRGKSAYFFWKVFMLDGPNTQEYEITPAGKVPGGYKVEKGGPFEEKIWSRFWKLALEPDEAEKLGIKNAQIEAPGTMFVPGILYTLKIEHDGGIRIDTQKLSPILTGEKIPS